MEIERFVRVVVGLGVNKIRLTGGEPLVRRIGDLTVVDIPLCYEAGDMKARVAFDADEKVASMFILNPDTP